MQVDETYFKSCKQQLKNIIRLYTTCNPKIQNFCDYYLVYLEQHSSSNPALSQQYEIPALIAILRSKFTVKSATPSNHGSSGIASNSGQVPSHDVPKSVESAPIIGSGTSLVSANNLSSYFSYVEHQSMMKQFEEFVRVNNNDIISSLSINRNLLPLIDSKQSLCVLGASKPQQNKKIVMCAGMKFESPQGVVDFSKEPKYFDEFLKNQRIPAALGIQIEYGHALESFLLHSLANLSKPALLVAKKANGKIVIAQLTPSAEQTIKSCNLAHPHEHNIRLQTSTNIKVFTESESEACLVEYKDIQTKTILRVTVPQAPIEIKSGVEIAGDKVQDSSKNNNYNFKFIYKFNANVVKYKCAYYVLFPNEANILNKIHKIDRIEYLIEKYENYRVVVGVKTSKLVPALFLKTLAIMKYAVGCATLSKITGNSCLVFKIAKGVNVESIADVYWQDIEQNKLPQMYYRLFCYSKENTKYYEAKGTLVDIKEGG